MRQSNFKALFGAALGVCFVGIFGGSNAAHAQVQCFNDPLSPFPYYYGCEEGAASTSGVGQSLQGIGESFVQQQLSTVPVGASPTGRLRHTSHDGMRDKISGTRRLGYEIDEGSVFGNVMYDLPGTYFGGKVRINGLIGYGWLDQKGDNVPGAPGVPTFSSNINSLFYGGSYMWSQGSFYTMSMIIGVSGDVDGIGVGGASYAHDLSGYFTNSVVGYTFQLPGPYKFDLRGSLGHYDVSSDRFRAPDNQAVGLNPMIKSSSEAWSGSITGTLFTLVEIDGGGVMRPYILGSYKNVFDEDIEIKGDFVGSFDQANNYGKVELGFDYVAGMMTYGAAVYTELSADESTIGARLGASIKLQ